MLNRNLFSSIRFCFNWQSELGSKSKCQIIKFSFWYLVCNSLDTNIYSDTEIFSASELNLKIEKNHNFCSFLSFFNNGRLWKNWQLLFSGKYGGGASKCNKLPESNSGNANETVTPAEWERDQFTESSRLRDGRWRLGVLGRGLVFRQSERQD